MRQNGRVTVDFGQSLDMNDSRNRKSLNDALTSLHQERLTGGIESIEFDLREVRWATVPALLFLVTLGNYVKKQLRLLPTIWLPVHHQGEDWRRAKKVRDFLKRWNFYGALRYYFDDETKVIAEDHCYYIVEEPLFYTRPLFRTGTEEDVELYTSGLLEMTWFSAKRADGAVVVDGGSAAAYANRYFQRAPKTGARLMDILSRRIAWPEGFESSQCAKLVRSCIWAPMDNAARHSQAEVALVAGQFLPNWFVMAVADDGLTIPKTMEDMLNQYIKAPEYEDTVLITRAFDLPYQEEIEYVEDALKSRNDPALIELAAAGPAIRIRSQGQEVMRGTGLYEMKRYVAASGGSMVVRSRCGSVRFALTEDGTRLEPHPEECPLGPGTVIYSFWPLKKADE